MLVVLGLCCGSQASLVAVRRLSCSVAKLFVQLGLIRTTVTREEVMYSISQLIFVFFIYGIFEIWKQTIFRFRSWPSHFTNFVTLGK